jgi:electron transport complex protein RnfA
VLAATLLNVEENYTFLESCVNGFAAGVGFALALVLFCGVRKALENAKPPKCFEGLPITLVAAALTSLTFMSFTGMAEKLFGG